MIEKARKLIREFDVRGGGPETHAGALSGGNQQKVILAREIDRDPKVLIAAQPTRGLDVGAIEFVHRRLIEERDEGRAILLVSLELEETLSLADRILVMFEGAIVGEYPPTVTEEELGFAMTGGEKGGGLTTDVQQIPAEPPGEPEPGSLVSRYRLLQKAEGLIAPLLTLLAGVPDQRRGRPADDGEHPRHAQDVPGHLPRRRTELVLPSGLRIGVLSATARLVPWNTDDITSRRRPTSSRRCCSGRRSCSRASPSRSRFAAGSSTSAATGSTSRARSPPC